MIVTTITIYVKPGHVAEFIAATVKNHAASSREPGNLRFDFLQCATDPTRFFLYEAYATAEAVAAHKQTAHYREWRDTVAPWMARPREGVPHTVLAPVDPGQWR